MDEKRETSQEAFDRGHHEGGVEARLREHEKHLNSINGSIERGVTGLADVKTALQQLASDTKAGLDTVIATANAAAATVVATADALAKADEARRKKSDASWSPWQKFIGLITSLVIAAGAAAGIYATLHH
jgi:hypothetical protein